MSRESDFEYHESFQLAFSSGPSVLGVLHCFLLFQSPVYDMSARRGAKREAVATKGGKLLTLLFYFFQFANVTDSQVRKVHEVD